MDVKILYNVFWFGKIFGNIIRAYRIYVKTSFAVFTMAYDGYVKRSKKDHEYTRRMPKQQPSAEVNVKKELTVHHTREDFLCNTRNKLQFIKLLLQYLKEHLSAKRMMLTHC